MYNRRVLYTVTVLSILVFASAMVYMLQNNGGKNESLNLQFPSGISSTFEAISTTRENQLDHNTVSVTGSGTAAMRADEATVTLGVQTQEANASEAIRLNAELMTDIIETINALGLTEDEIKTVTYNVYPVYAKDEYDTVSGYRVINMISVKIKDMELIGKVIDSAANEGANKIQGVSFELSEEKQRELKREAYLTALGDAEEKAKLIAERLNLTITGVLYVSENTYQPYKPYYDYRFELAGTPAPTTPIIEGNLSVSVTAHVIYSFA